MASRAAGSFSDSLVCLGSDLGGKRGTTSGTPKSKTNHPVRGTRKFSRLAARSAQTASADTKINFWRFSLSKHTPFLTIFASLSARSRIAILE